MSFCNQMAAAIDGARTLTRLDHLSRSIWQGLAAGTVADDDAQALAERLHARRSVLRGEIKPVASHLADPRSSHLGGCNAPPSARWRLPDVGTSPPPVRCRLRWPASSRSASWRCCGSSETRCASRATVIGALMKSQRGPGCAGPWSRTRSALLLGWACSRSRSAVARAAATSPMSSGSFPENGRYGWPGEGGRAVHQPSR